MTDRDSSRPKGYGFCEYRDEATAQSAKRNLHDREFMGRKLNIDLSTKYKSELSGVGDHGHGGAAGGGMGGVRYAGGDPHMGFNNMGGPHNAMRGPVGRPPPPITHGTAGGNMRPPAAPLVTPQQAVQNSVQSKSGQEAYTILNVPAHNRPCTKHRIFRGPVRVWLVRVCVALTVCAVTLPHLPSARVCTRRWRASLGAVDCRLNGTNEEAYPK